LVTADEIGDPGHLAITTRVNGVTRQHGNTEHLIHSIPDIIGYLSTFMTLAPGDVILTGTPDGISPVVPGDLMECSVEKLGVLTNLVVKEESDS
jgi:2-keto-4-pentenoate hydratase/2-oxohepta-3-ene-1,7-dioic acid hydratase in catechol pathway